MKPSHLVFLATLFSPIAFSEELSEVKPILVSAMGTDCSELKNTSENSNKDYENYIFCEIDNISSSLNGIVRRHNSNFMNSKNISSIEIQFSVSSTGEINGIIISKPEGLDEILVKKLSARLSMLKVAGHEGGLERVTYPLEIH